MWGKVQGKPGVSFQESSPSGGPQGSLIPQQQAVMTPVKWHQPGKFAGSSVPGFYWANHKGRCRCSRLPEAKADIRHTPCCLDTLGTVTPLTNEGCGKSSHVPGPKCQPRGKLARTPLIGHSQACLLSISGQSPTLLA